MLHVCMYVCMYALFTHQQEGREGGQESAGWEVVKSEVDVQ